MSVSPWRRGEIGRLSRSPPVLVDTSPPPLPGSIRLLSLLPSDKNGYIQCKLFDYPIQGTKWRVGTYEALSYVWGDSCKPWSISTGKDQIPTTANQYEALSYLEMN